MAVKVQYPGVAAAVRADMQNLGIILRLMKRVAPGLDVKATAEEIRSRIGDELDYELEATEPALAGADLPQPPVHRRAGRGHRLSREKVMVSEFVHGVGFDAVKETDQATRDRVGEIVFRFYFGCMYRHGQFSGDPHPGNFLLLGDGRVAFLDFGLFKVMPRNLIELELEMPARRPRGRRPAAVRDLRRGRPAASKPERFRPDKVLSQFLDATWWYLTDEEIELGPEIATQVMIDMSDPRSEHFGQMRHETLPADHIFGRRVEMLTLAVLGQLRARANWHRIAREWIYGDEPVTELGRAEAAFYGASSSAQRPGGAAARGSRRRRRPPRPLPLRACRRWARRRR